MPLFFIDDKNCVVGKLMHKRLPRKEKKRQKKLGQFFGGKLEGFDESILNIKRE